MIEERSFFFLKKGNILTTAYPLKKFKKNRKIKKNEYGNKQIFAEKYLRKQKIIAYLEKKHKRVKEKT